MTADADLHTLTGAYALHALSDEERARFTRHLSACRPCAQEVAEFTATTAKLAAAVAVTPRPDMKRDVLRRAATVRQVSPHTRAPRPAGTFRRRMPRLVAAACLALAVGLGGVTVGEHRRAEDTATEARRARQATDELIAVLGAPDAVTRRVPLDGGADASLVLSAARDKALLVASGMSAPPRGKVYQLWYDVDGTMRPAGLMDAHRTTQAVLLTGSPNSASAVGITVEPAGGSARPTTAPLALVTLPA
ncbi:anti-sigma factor [Streptomyces sp. CRN 30]|uniref:anti-sigma factor n=1 Tax=Streptomyces sp. CRN 30 TaxID=3075613 RepID=UPI002A8323D1|nr:anti-sigma factor [Streptomyces sp. CRN 30]